MSKKIILCNSHYVDVHIFVTRCFPQGYWDGYDPNVNPNVIDAFAAAAFRFGHSLLPTAIERWSKAHKFIGTLNAMLTELSESSGQFGLHNC
jgi:hypothetical protein